ncbi:hypothetical protein MKEN_00018600 [Mycena kentingensis (nom. inval.)]|nr:hypothetical protein MKEN_00018600 [Mycena kentingensis (nom. inval.)]
MSGYNYSRMAASSPVRPHSRQPLAPSNAPFRLRIDIPPPLSESDMPLFYPDSDGDEDEAPPPPSSPVAMDIDITPKKPLPRRKPAPLARRRSDAGLPHVQATRADAAPYPQTRPRPPNSMPAPQTQTGVIRPLKSYRERAKPDPTAVLFNKSKSSGKPAAASQRRVTSTPVPPPSARGTGMLVAEIKPKIAEVAELVRAKFSARGAGSQELQMSVGWIRQPQVYTVTGPNATTSVLLVPHILDPLAPVAQGVSHLQTLRHPQSVAASELGSLNLYAPFVYSFVPPDDNSPIGVSLQDLCAPDAASRPQILMRDANCRVESLNYQEKGPIAGVLIIEWVGYTTPHEHPFILKRHTGHFAFIEQHQEDHQYNGPAARRQHPADITNWSISRRRTNHIRFEQLRLVEVVSFDGRTFYLRLAVVF